MLLSMLPISAAAEDAAATDEQTELSDAAAFDEAAVYEPEEEDASEETEPVEVPETAEETFPTTEAEPEPEEDCEIPQDDEEPAQQSEDAEPEEEPAEEPAQQSEDSESEEEPAEEPAQQSEDSESEEEPAEEPLPADAEATLPPEPDVILSGWGTVDGILTYEKDRFTAQFSLDADAKVCLWLRGEVCAELYDGVDVYAASLTGSQDDNQAEEVVELYAGIYSLRIMPTWELAEGESLSFTLGLEAVSEQEPELEEPTLEEAPEEMDPVPVADYVFFQETVDLADLIQAVGITLSQNNYVVSVDSDAITLPGDKYNKQSGKAFPLIAKKYFELATLRLESTNGKDSHMITLSYPEPDWDDPMECDGLSLSASDVVELIGRLPQNAVAVLEAQETEIEGEEVLASYDIRIFANEHKKEAGQCWQPTEQSVTVRMQSDAFASELLNIYHSPADGAPEFVTTVEALDGVVEFQADSFSVWTVSRTIEKTITASDGKSYHFSVTYGADAKLPGDTDLNITELSGTECEDYLGRAAVKMEAASFAYGRVFDISLVDGAGNALQPAAPVQVSASLLDGEGAELYSVIHFEGEQEDAAILSAETEGNSVSFQTDGFSAYAIVQGPSAIPIGWKKIQSLDDLLAHAEDDLYIGHIDGYYFTDGITPITASRTGVTKTKPPQSVPPSSAVAYHFEPAGESDQFYISCASGYLCNTGNNSLSLADEANKTAFSLIAGANSVFRIHNGDWYVNMQGGARGDSFAAYNAANDGNNSLYIWYYDPALSDPYDLDGKSYGLVNYEGGTIGKAMMSSPLGEGALSILPLTVMTKAGSNEDKLLVPNDSDISFWTFHWLEDDRYYLTTVVDGSTKYLSVSENGLALVSETDENCRLTVVPGTGAHAGEICLKSASATLCYSGSESTGFTVTGSAGDEWLCLTELSELTQDYVMTYSASKVSVSDPSVGNGSRIIVYTRVWNEEKLRYEFYAIDHDGSLVPCFESGDSIQWVGGRINTLLWNFVEYYWEGTNDPNYYYDFYNQYSEKFLAPQMTDGQILSDEPIGVNLNGRRNGRYYTPIVAWDDNNYAIVGLKVEDGQIAAGPFSEAEDFYFAVMQDTPVDDTLTTVPTVDHTQYGITMKLVNFDTRAEMSNFLGDDSGGAVKYTVPGLLSTELGEDGYPTAAGGSLGTLFAGGEEVNHLFIASTLNATGYYEFDSAQNFASLQEDHNFKVYKELGSYDSGGNKPTLKHGQFFPFNDLEPGVFASVNGKNLYSSTGGLLPESDPRKYEQLYLVKNTDCYFGMEIEASFTQTPSGLDDWKHDIIYEFTGDDDFWLYVDGELVIDLGGIHSALPGSVNFRTGEVNVNGQHTTLYELFYQNYLGRGHTEEEAQAYVDEKFEQNSAGQWIFKEYTTHTMRIFYMERGAGASNLHTRFNLASVKPGTVDLSKQLSGVDTTESMLAQFLYQIWYKKAEDDTEYLLTQDKGDWPCVLYKDTATLVPYYASFPVDGVDYPSVFLLKPDETAEITFPDDAVSYRIVECGVNTEVYSGVTVNGTAVEGTAVEGCDNRSDFGIDYATTKERARVAYVNQVNPDALRTLTIMKKLYDETGENELRNDTARFSFRLALGTEYDTELTPAMMYTYHVKDQEGAYCVWNAEQQAFVSLGKTNYSDLSAEEKENASFHTSLNGAITQIPAYYSVEIREVLAGTQYRVEERSNEIPDGYSFQKYELYRDVHDSACEESVTPLQGTVETHKDPLAAVCNLKGWGLRVVKSWSDAEYMAERDATYFAVFTGSDEDSLSLVEGTVRRLPQSESSLYWYFQVLPVNVPFDQYEIREVIVQNPTVDESGVVTAYDSLTLIHPGGTLILNGKQKGESESSGFNYTVSYTKGSIPEDSNVRADTVENIRPGILLRKQDWNGNPLEDAAFTLADQGGELIGSFVSDAEGLITVAFLRENADYLLTETKAPQSYHGPEQALTLRLEGETLRVSGPEAAYYEVTEEDGSQVLIVKNRPYSFQAVKKDAKTGEPLSNVTFALHRQVTVDGVTTIDLNPMPGYERLVTDAGGLVPKLDNTLTAGTYELRELSAPTGYYKLDAYIRFTVSPTGEIQLGTHPDGVSLSSVTEASGAIAYEMTVLNYTDAALTVTKTVIGNMGDLKKAFTFTLESVAGEASGAVYAWTKTDADGETSTGTISVGGSFQLAHGERIVILLPMNRDIVLSEDNGDYTTGWEFDGGAASEGSSTTVKLSGDAVLAVTNHKEVTVDTGIDSIAEPYVWMFSTVLLVLSASVLLRILRRRERDES